VSTPALYETHVVHDRHQRIQRSFGHRTYMWLVDVDALPRYPWYLRPFTGFRASDHVGDPGRTIRSNVDGYLAEHGIDVRGGRVIMLANAAALGYNFNPLSVFWCYHGNGELACLVAEVHNTYGERHCYLLRPDAAGRAQTNKTFYVSPFLTVDGRYLMKFSAPGPTLTVTITLRQENRTVFTARLSGERMPADARTVLKTVAKRPLVSLWVATLIRRHGLALWLRKLPVVPRQAPKAVEGAR
jgi:hypothetical protein